MPPSSKVPPSRLESRAFRKARGQYKLPPKKVGFGAARLASEAHAPISSPAVRTRGTWISTMQTILGQKTTPATAAPADLIKDSSERTFAADVLEASREVPVLVDFWAPWCGPCKQLTPVLEKLVREAKGAVKLVKINIDENKRIATQMRIQSIPAVYAFRNGQPVDGFMGALKESDVREFIKRLGGEAGPSPTEELLGLADEAFNAGDLGTAAQAYGQILQEEPQNPAALGGLARCYLTSGDIDRAKQTLAMVPPEHEANPAITAVHARVLTKKESTTVCAGRFERWGRSRQALRTASATACARQLHSSCGRGARFRATR